MRDIEWTRRHRMMSDRPSVADVMATIRAELERAMSVHGPMKSDREGLDVIREEFAEMELAVWFGVDHRGQPADAHEEAIQLGAMAARFLLDVPHAGGTER